MTTTLAQRVVNAYEEYLLLVYRSKITARLGLEMMQTIGRVEAEAEKIRKPLLVMQGGADCLVSPEGVSVLYERAGASDKTIGIYDGFYHEIRALRNS